MVIPKKEEVSLPPMGRWTQYDEDEYRLPEGMVRVGYDADSATYFYRDSQGVLYSGAEGVEYGNLTRVSDAEPALEPDAAQDGGDIEAAPARSDGYMPLSVDDHQPNANRSTKGAYRSLFPFFLIIAVSLLLVWRLIISPATVSQKSDCPERSMAYWVKPGDSCWEIAKEHECRLEDLVSANPKVDCLSLMPGTTMCLPVAAVPSSSALPSTKKVS